MKTLEQIIALLKESYHLAIGERTAEEIMNRCRESGNQEIGVSGRSYDTGEKETVLVPKSILN